MKLNIKAFAISVSLFWGISIFTLTWWYILLNGATNDKTFLGDFYFGYNISPIGSLIGLIWGILEGLIGGAVFAWLYNKLTDK
jgi:hypothetical protein